MKTLIATTAIALTVATGAFAMTGTTDLELATIASYAPGADLSNLSDATVDTLVRKIHGGGNAGDIWAAVQGALRAVN